MGGVYGSLMTGLFCEQAINPSGGFDGAFYGNPIQFWHQIACVLVVVGFCSATTALICVMLHLTIGLKVSKLEAQIGMDNLLTPHQTQDDTQKYTDQAMHKVRQTLAGQQTAFTEKEEAHLHHVFSLIDDHQTGKVTLQKFQAALRMMNISIPKDEAAVLFARFDSDQSGTIEYEEFRAMMLQANRGSQLSLSVLPDIEAEPLVIQERTAVDPSR